MKQRDHALDLLKIAATLIVIICHYEDAFDIQNKVLIAGNGKTLFVYVIELFFIISGFLAFSGVRKINDGLSFNRYFFGKVLRLLPLAALSTLLYSAAFFKVWAGEGFSLFKVLVTAFCIQTGGPFTESLYNSHLWYLSVLLICYAFFFIIVRLAQKRGFDWRYGCIFMVLLGASVYATECEYPFLNTAVSRGYMAFFTGLLLASVLDQRRPGRAAVIISASVTAVTLLLLIFRYSIMEYGLEYIMTFVFYPALIVLFESAPSQKLLDRRVFGTMAQVSFSVYIWHFEFYTLCAIVNDIRKLGVNFSNRLIETAVLITVIGIGAVSFCFIETPLNRLIKEKTGSMPNVADASTSA